MKKKLRVIDELRKEFPGHWTWDPYMYQWHHEDGWYVHGESTTISTNWCGGEAYVTSYRRSDTGELVIPHMNRSEPA